MGKINLSLQLYTLRNEMGEDFAGTLQKVADMGYQYVEFAGYGGLSAVEMNVLLEKLGLKAPSSHVAFSALQEAADEQIAYAKAIGVKYIVIPGIQAATFQEAFDETIASIRSIAEQCSAAGLQLCYHNHDFEFNKLGDSWILDRLFQATASDELKMELDLYWVSKANLNPVEYIAGYKGRVPLVHLKDMAAGEERTFAEVGHGILDIPALIEASLDAGVEYFVVEQDTCKGSALDSVRMSMEYLKSNGYV